MKSLIVLLCLALAVALTVTACSGDSGDAERTSSSSDLTSSLNSIDCSANERATLGELMWDDVFAEGLLETDNWLVRSTDASDRFVSVFRDGDVVGQVELERISLDSNFNPAEGIATMTEWANESYELTESQRLYTYGETYVFESRDPQPNPVGSFCGISFGSSGAISGDEVYRLAAFATFDSENMYVFSALFDASRGDDAGFADGATLEEYETYLLELAAVLTLPPL
ncbi:MAG: hypothetical protein IH957_00495 [Chloroflexi bacterium]|nr:hypothetical protein [Chloroflexota bacterium]